MDEKNKSGRKLFDGKSEEIIIAKLEEAFSFGCTDAEACIFADISPSAFYRFLEVRPTFQERRDMLRVTPVLKARQSVMKGLEKDPKLALQYLLLRGRIERRSTQINPIHKTSPERSKEMETTLRKLGVLLRQDSEEKPQLTKKSQPSKPKTAA